MDVSSIETIYAGLGSLLHPVLAQADSPATVQGLYADVRAWLAVNGVSWALRGLAALAIVLIGRWAAKFVAGLVTRSLGRVKVDDTVARFLAKIAQVLLIVVGIIAALEMVGVKTTSLVAIIGAAGLAVGLALQGSLSNFAAGVMIVLFRPFRVGNFIEAGGVKGIVEEISIFHTILRTPDNLAVIVPNSSVNGGAITNYSGKPTRRIDLTIGVSYSDDLKVAQATIRRVVEGEARILKEPAPIIGPMNLADSAVEIVVWVWVNSPDFLSVKFFLIETLKTELERAGCSIPFPQRDVHLFPAPSTPERPAA